MKYENLNAFIEFRNGDHWIVLARDVFFTISVFKNETRIGINISPILEEYCKGTIGNVEIRIVPLFSNENKPGIIILIDGEVKAREKLFRILKRKFHGRIIFEDSYFDWPENGSEILEKFNLPEMYLQNSVIYRVENTSGPV